MTRWVRRAIMMGAGFSLAASLAVAAQPAPQPAQQQPSGAMQGFQINRDQPVKIESLTLEVRDKQHQATFAGNVKLTQGDTTIQCKSLVVFYEDSAPAAPAASAKGAPVAAAPAPKPATPGFGGGNQQIKRVEARGDVLVTQKDQTAKGENGVFDIKTNAITLTGNVVVTQGTNVLTGERMVVNLTTGVTTVESGKSASGKSAPVTGMFSPSAPAPGAAPAPAPAPAPAVQKNAKPAPPAKSAPGAPIRINQNMLLKKPAT
ncbi:MAG: lipopolysaccharide export system protein LptA [Alphaproteobacteria bacterium]|nr:lipopolysaccharide export system protein LptA [Alphaproteobacteria bacterium]